MFKILPQRSTFRRKKLPPKEAENYVQLKEEWTYTIFNDEKKFCLDDYAGFYYYFQDLQKKSIVKAAVWSWKCNDLDMHWISW
ncbi:hypothetical protein TNIN_465101 [Trichonephila inaurata madagascariensis]|uniref:Uncharacterized protein n=1 Tax=Trichonephila inaurata madagascariensis TaxID=2747483 RepID=A0A8X6Y0K5_9ARAC|nr:hypothetical protein TNIN_465101 [Trichonephila inaurata madagascariensis]